MDELNFKKYDFKSDYKTDFKTDLKTEEPKKEPELTDKEKLTLDSIPRCPECNLIASIKLSYKGGKPSIIYYCENKHDGTISLEEYLQKASSHSLIKEKCAECFKKQNETKGDYSFCSKCNKFLCHTCTLNHPNNVKHDTVNFKRYDSFCKKHFNFFSFYCFKCKKNLCMYCKTKHASHDIIELSDLNFSEEAKQKFEEKVSTIEKRIKDFDTIKQELITQIDNLKKSSELELNLYKLLISTFQFEESQKNLNYNVFQNLKNFDEIFGLNKSSVCEKIFKEGKRYLSYLEKSHEDIGQTNLCQNNFKTLSNHSHWVCFLSKLQDGRLASSSNDCSINIYKKDSFELQLSIKEHSGPVRYFIQLQNGNLVTCSADKTMNIIKLLDENKYKVEQKLKEHTSCVSNVIEVKDNEILSASNDSTLKKWELDDKNVYNCTNTIKFQNSESYCNLLKIDEDEFVTSSFSDKSIRFWKFSDFTNIASLFRIDTEWTSKVLCKIPDSDMLLAGGRNSKGFYLIRISTHQLIKNIIGPQTINSIYLCNDGLILCSIRNEKGNYAIVKYKYESLDLEKVVEKEKIHEDRILSSIELDDGTIVTGGDDNLIKLWRD